MSVSVTMVVVIRWEIIVGICLPNKYVREAF